MTVKVRSRALSVSGILYFKFIWIDDMQIITEWRIVQRQNIIYVAELEIKVWAYFKNVFSQSSSVVDYAQKLNSHFPLFLTNHWVWNKISTTGATTGAGTAYPYDVPKFSPAFSGIRVALSLFVLFSLGQCNICPSIYDFWLPFWDLKLLFSVLSFFVDHYVICHSLIYDFWLLFWY